ncbi:unnamed protein product [Parnassius mnemosyne]|uniref:CAAX prenyl protease n=1 Tax=Parnassius mnemosyne TaxID=213953 RepID=A0AAV1KRZ2_9NEOP
MLLNEDLIVWLILLFSWTEYIWELYLSLRQLNIYKTNNTIPDDLNEMLTEESFKKARLYGIDKSKFKIVKDFYSIALISIILKGIEDLASKLHFPLSQVYIVEGSKRSAHSNAYFSGLFGAKRIVLFDTLVEKHDEQKKVTTGCTDNEILGILAHELGHWSCSHIYKSIALTEVNLLLLFTAFGLLFKYSMLYTALGFPAGQEPVIIGLIVVLQMILAPYNSLLSFFATALSRKFEFEADNFAVSLNYPNELRSALIKLGKDNLDYPIYDKLYSAWYHSHPTLLHRIENIKNKIANEKND